MCTHQGSAMHKKVSSIYKHLLDISERVKMSIDCVTYMELELEYHGNSSAVFGIGDLESKSPQFDQ